MRRRAFLQLGCAAMAAPWAARLHAAARGASTVDDYWSRVLGRMPPGLAAVAAAPEHEVQLRAVRVRRDADGHATFDTHDHGLAPRRWFAAASVAKLPMALLMAERVHALGLDAHAVIAVDAPPATGAWPADEPLAERFGRGLARTFAVSDNAPYNRWYELLGGDAIHARLAELGYPHARLVSRLGSSDADANRRTGGGSVRAADGRIAARLAPAHAQARHFPFGRALKGTGWQRDDGAVDAGPHDFSTGNFLPLADSLRMLQAFVRPDSVPAHQRWRIDGALRSQLLRLLALRPRDSDDPRYDEAAHPDGYARWLLVGDGAQRYPDGVGVFGKTGMAYGYLSEVAYLVDAASGAELLLAASIHVNADGVFNDDRYEYDTIGRPFLAALGRAVLAVERDATGRLAPSQP
ncbi:serine hydrolase [Cognatilysobacter tabacisoli]|uniref:serine hydrolase n=1 Tax=Cognatilysobacter tabacisoli TaxID=2315424 RepID=UPI000E6B32F8|nr:serine hydrolase [Lysobacter tabacisoli]